MPDWAWWIPMNVILIASIVWDAVRRERVYREIRRNTERIGRNDARRTGGQEREGAGRDGE